MPNGDDPGADLPACGRNSSPAFLEVEPPGEPQWMALPKTWRAPPSSAPKRRRLRGEMVACSLSVMTNEERKQVVRQLLTEGRTLSEIQDFLRKEKNDSITYMELRLLLSEMPDIKLPEKEPPKASPLTIADSGAKAAAATADTSPGKPSISVDQVPAPGSMLTAGRS